MSRCVLPFIGYDYQHKNPCCLLENYNDSKDRKKLLKEHNSDIKSEYCKKCYTQEDVGIKSKRQQYNELYKKYLHYTERKQKIAVIPVGNVCNLSCVTCGPSFSTGWIKKSKTTKFERHTASDSNKQTANIIRNIQPDTINDVDKLEHVEYIGGETLRSQSLWDHLGKMNKEASFSMTTNGTFWPSRKQLELLGSFKNFNICFSLDGFGKIFEYIRQPASWMDVCTNVRKFVKTFGKEKFSIYLTVSNINIFYIDRIMIELYKLIPVPIDLNLVHRPPVFNHSNQPKEIGEIIERHNPIFFKNNNIQWKGNANSLKQTLYNLKLQDKYSGLNFQSHLPEVYNLINDYIEKTSAKE